MRDEDEKLLEKADDLITDLTILADRSWAAQLNVNPEAEAFPHACRIAEKYCPFTDAVDFNKIAGHLEMGMSVVRIGDEFFGTVGGFQKALYEKGCAQVQKIASALCREHRALVPDGEKMVEAYLIMSPSYVMAKYFIDGIEVKDLFAAYGADRIDSILESIRNDGQGMPMEGREK